MAKVGRDASYLTKNCVEVGLVSSGGGLSDSLLDTLSETSMAIVILEASSS